MGIAQFIEALKMCLGRRKSLYPRYEYCEDDHTPTQSQMHKNKSHYSQDQNIAEPTCRKCQGHWHQVVYVPGPDDPFDRGMAAQRDRQIRRQTVQTDLDLNLPVSIPRSQDGEEGYTVSQRLLHTREVSNESVRPPPNRTICEGDPPPPYRSNSVGLLDKSNARDWSTNFYGNSQYFAPINNSDNNNTRNWNFCRSFRPDPCMLSPYQHNGQSRAASTHPPNNTAVPTSGHPVNNSPSTDSQSSRSHPSSQASLLPSYDMIVGKRESES